MHPYTEYKQDNCMETPLFKQRTTAGRQLADALVARVGHEHVAACINGHAGGLVEAAPTPVSYKRNRKR